MDLSYTQGLHQTAITYGEPLVSALASDRIVGKHVIILTNQRYYDYFFEKIYGLFAKQPVDWYVCSNLVYGNHLQELTSVLEFLGRFSTQEDYLFLAFGNEGVVQLTGFLHATSILQSEFWVIPVSLRSYAAALAPQRFICKQPTEYLLQTNALAQQLFLDQTIVAGQKQGKLVDLLTFLRAGIVCDVSLLRTLYQTFPTTKQLQKTSFTAFVEPLTELYEQSAMAIESFGQLFEQAFYLTEHGHLLSENMKRLLGVLLQLNWNLSTIDSTFHLKNFLIWLKHLGFPIAFPDELSIAEYLQNVLHLQARTSNLVVLSEIGTIGETRKLNEQELLQAMTRYQELLAEI